MKHKVAISLLNKASLYENSSLWGSSAKKDSEFTSYQHFGYLFTVIDVGNKALLHTSDTLRNQEKATYFKA